MKPLMKPEERAFAKTMARLIVCNHFLPERIQLEREALGSDFVDSATTPWNVNFDSPARSPNVLRLGEKTAAITEGIHQRFLQGGRLTASEFDEYESLVYYHLYQRYRGDFQSITLVPNAPCGPVKAYDQFTGDARKYLQPLQTAPSPPPDHAHLFAGLWQVERAFINIFQNIVGSSPSIARLRASVWESIFTWNFKRYRQGLYDGMQNLTTLITGPSGTGKELVARAIAASGYIPFDPHTRRFTLDHHTLFHPLNLSALPSTLIESELFGHKRGAFTGALKDHAGWLEVCPRGGSVFLDEIGEIDASLQVKLLRVLQTRSFHRLGESRPIPFLGKIITASNRDVVAEIHAGRFREDFYYRICSDVISTPSLREQLAETPADLPRLVRFIARRLVSAEQVEELSQEVVHLVDAKLGPGYAWPGNFRELEQCVRNVLVRGRYEPAAIRPKEPAATLAADVSACRLTADQLLQRYCSLVYAQTRNLEETARRLNLDRRTVKSKLGGALSAEGSCARESQSPGRS